MAGETDLTAMLSNLTVTTRPGTWTFVSSVQDPRVLELSLADDGVDALVREDEGITAVVRADVAQSLGVDTDFAAAWLTLDVHSALEAVGLTAAVARVLAAEDIPCNVLAAAHHDHLLVPADRTDDALAALRGLADGV